MTDLLKTLIPNIQSIKYPIITDKATRLLENNQYSLELYLPGVPKNQIQLSKSGDELNIRIGNHRRNLVLPQALAALQPGGAKMEEDYLKIRFSEQVKV